MSFCIPLLIKYTGAFNQAGSICAGASVSMTNRANEDLGSSEGKLFFGGFFLDFTLLYVLSVSAVCFNLSQTGSGSLSGSSGCFPSVSSSSSPLPPPH